MHHQMPKTGREYEDPASIMFVARTRGGILANQLRSLEPQLCRLTRERVKVIERNGKRLLEILVKNNPWSSEPCTRQNCPVCQQEVRPKVPGCHKRNITYVNVCLTCEEEGRKTQYVGESSRSLAERYQEHLDDAKGNKEESHMWIHSRDQHQGIMRYKVSQIKGHKSAMMRQISESIEIKIRSAEGINLLNNKAEHNLCLYQNW